MTLLDVCHYIFQVPIINPNDVQDLKDFMCATTVADVSDTEFNIAIRSQQPEPFDDEPAIKVKLPRQSSSKSRTNKTVTPIKIRRNPATPKTTIVRKPTPATKTVKFASSFDPSSVGFEPPSEDFARPCESAKPTTPELSRPKARVPNKTLMRDLKPLIDDLRDLIPPDVDALGIDLDKLLLATPDADNSDYDSVSCGSSDLSFYSFDEDDNEYDKPKRPLETVKNGVRLDLIKVEPPSKEFISSLPKPEVYRCKNPNCGFTTSSSDYIKFHRCR